MELPQRFRLLRVRQPKLSPAALTFLPTTLRRPPLLVQPEQESLRLLQLAPLLAHQLQMLLLLLVLLQLLERRLFSRRPFSLELSLQEPFRRQHFQHQLLALLLSWLQLSSPQPSLLAFLLRAVRRALALLAQPYDELGRPARLPLRKRRCARQCPSTLKGRGLPCS